MENGEHMVTARLVDHVTGEQIWGDEYHTAPRPGRWSGPLDDIARVVAARVGAEEGVITQLLAAERRRQKMGPMTPYGAIMLSYEFFLARDPQTLAPALDALHQVVKAEPECGAAWTRLARLCIANHTFEVTPIPTPIDEAITYAHRGVRVDPASRRARCILAAALHVKGELAAARAELEEALRLSPDSLVYLEIIGYFLTLAGDEDRGPALIRSARLRNPHCLPNAGHGLWFDHLRRGAIDQAYQVALEYRDPTFFWRSVMRASSLGLLGRTAEAKAEVADLLRWKPDFAARGRTLIGYYIKPPEMMSRIADGLARAGLKLA
jgi:tetratricopeptide (TPR) repeat protein